MPDIDNLTNIAHAYVPRLLRTEDWISVRPYVMELSDSHLLGWASSRETLRNDMLALTWTVHVATTVLCRTLTHDGVLAPDVIEYAVNTSPWTTRVRGTRRSVLIRLGRELNPDWPFGETAVRYGYTAPDARIPTAKCDFLSAGLPATPPTTNATTLDFFSRSDSERGFASAKWQRCEPKK